MRHKSQTELLHPAQNGGNVDTKHLVEGSKVLLPVFVRGALFSCGDGHAAQGDGEVCGSAIETHMLVKARLTVIKPGAGGLQPSAPLLQYLTPGKEVG